jgi:hypothetical protein
MLKRGPGDVWALSFRLAALALLAVGPRAEAEIAVLGYAGVAGPGKNLIGSVKAAAVPTNLASIDFPETWTAVDLGAIVSTFQGAGVRAALFLDNVLFKKFYVNASPCADEAGPFSWALRANWQSRLANFFAANAAYIDEVTTALLVVSSEVNNRCTDLGQVGTAATAVKGYFPSLPTVMGYGRSPGARPAPAFVPATIDWVGFFKYGTFDPTNPAHPYNADDRYLIELAALEAKLAAHQRILLVADGFWAEFLHRHLTSHLGPGSGWPKWYLASLALNYEALARSEPKVVGMLVFLWSSPALPGFQGTADLPESVREAHRAIGCRNLGC